jgi:4-hydroxy-tetrahydrodipicolinate reductase
VETIDVVVRGVLGKMGQEVVRALCRDTELTPVAGVDAKAAESELALPDGSGSIPLAADLDSILARIHADVMVDFTSAGAVMPAVRSAIVKGVRPVVGTTGLTSADNNEIKSLCQTSGVGAVIAPNFSLAAVVMIHLAKLAARYFDYAEIIEMHHEQKADSPSGTALTTAKEMIEARGEAFRRALTAHESVAGCRGGEYEGIALHSLRMPGMLAHQEIVLGAPGQTLRLRLDQISREAFMPCVTLAVKKVMELREAVFGMDSLLGLEGESC